MKPISMAGGDLWCPKHGYRSWQYSLTKKDDPRTAGRRQLVEVTLVNHRDCGTFTIYNEFQIPYNEYMKNYQEIRSVMINEMIQIEILENAT